MRSFGHSVWYILWRGQYIAGWLLPLIVSYPKVTIDACEMEFRVMMGKNVFEQAVSFITITIE